jgi:ribosomal-protein-alanine N-acetyltransferase
VNDLDQISEKDFILKSNRITIRPIKKSDVHGLWPHFSNPSITTFLAWNPHRTLEESLSVISSLISQHKSGTSFHWVVLAKDKPIGLVSLIDVITNLRAWRVDRAELAYWISPEHQKRGYATEASSLVCRFAFEVLKLHKILIYHAKENPASKRVSEKLGANLVGTLKDGFMKDAVWYDLGLYELLNPQSEKRLSSS